MLQSLIIQNYALISELRMEFERGFSVITGETGAGKSILLGAIGLLLGGRAEARMIKSGAKRCIIEAEFDLTGYQMESFFEDNDIDFDGHSCIIRRELSDNGKSRAFINDTPVQVVQLRTLGSQLLDIHSQHQNLLLSQENFQLNVVDIIAHDQQELQSYRSLFDAYHQAQRALLDAESSLARGREDEDYLRFQLQQLDDLQLEIGKQEEMEQEQQVLEHAEEIREALWTAEQFMQGDERTTSGVLQTLHDVERQLSSIASLLPAADELTERINNCHIELKDIASELNTQATQVDVDPARLEVVNEWLSNFYSAQQKHHVQSEQQLLDLAEDFRRRLALIDNSDEQLEALRNASAQAKQALMKQGTRLTGLRKKAAQEVEKKMKELLVPLGIPNVQFHITINERPEPSTTGLDSVNFLFCANKNGQLQDIADIASGGEIARVMLSLKALISTAVHQPTIIFDEIDTGVSGHIAERMATMMKTMGDEGRQVISITHLPQIAAMGSHHYRVFKLDDDEGTTSHIEHLDAEKRIIEIAHMLSGAELTDAAIENAKSLLSHAQTL